MEARFLKSRLVRGARALLLSVALAAGVATTPTLAAAPQKVVIYQAFQSLLYLPLYVGIDTGQFTKQGLDVQKVTAGSGAAGVSAVIGAHATFSLQDPMIAVLANLKGATLTNVALVVNGAPVWIAVPGTSPVHKFSDLAGKTVATAIPPSTGTYLLERLLKRDKMKVTLDTVQLGTELAPLTAGRDQAATLFEPQLDEAVAAGDRIVYAFTKNYPGGYAFSTIDTLRSTVASNPAMVQKFVAGLAAAEALMHRSPKLAATIAEREFPGLPKPVVQAAVARMVALDVYPAGPAISPKAFANALSLQEYIGNIKPGQVSYAGAVDDRFAAPAGHH